MTGSAARPPRIAASALVAGLLASAITTALAQGVPAPGAAVAGIEATAAEDFAADRQLRSAMAQIRAGQMGKALDELKPLLALYERRFDPSRQVVFTSRTPEERNAYLAAVDAAAKARPQAPVRTPVFAPLLWSDALYVQAYALIELRRFPEAEAALKSALLLAPRNARYRIELGTLYTARKQLPAALQAMRQAARDAQDVSPPEVRDTEVTRAWSSEAFILLTLGELVDAERLYRQCLQMNPNDQDARRGLEQVRTARANRAPAGLPSTPSPSSSAPPSSSMPPSSTVPPVTSAPVTP